MEMCKNSFPITTRKRSVNIMEALQAMKNPNILYFHNILHYQVHTKKLYISHGHNFNIK